MLDVVENSLYHYAFVRQQVTALPGAWFLGRKVFVIVNIAQRKQQQDHVVRAGRHTPEIHITVKH